VQIVFVNAFHMNLWDDVKLYRSKKKLISLPISLAPETLDGCCLPLRPGTLLGQSKYEKTSDLGLRGKAIATNHREDL